MTSQVRERIGRVESQPVKIRALPWGLSRGEIVACALVLIFFVISIVYYLTALKPNADRLRVAETQFGEQDRTYVELVKSLGVSNQKGAAQPLTAQEALDSLETFKSRYLKRLEQGRIELFNEINALSKKAGVQLTTGIEMTSDVFSKAEPAKSGKRQAKKSDEDASLIASAFPKLAIHFSVFGQYANLRTFINEIEHDKQLVVINDVSLTNQEAKASGRAPRGVQAGSVSGIVLAIELTAYFKPR